jgi:hypothetical protein
VRRVRVQIETTRQRIVGVLQLPTEGYRSRTTDFLNAHDTGFIALTDVEVRNHDGGDPTVHGFVAVGSRHIVALAEIEDLGVMDEEAVQPHPALGTVSVPPPGT